MDFLKRIEGLKKPFDLLILSCAREEEAHFWQRRLEQFHPAVTVVVEDWSEGGAGNAFGTLQAIQKAEQGSGPSPLAILQKGGSVALYHAAGKGTRMEPLTQAAGGMKAAIQLPAFLPDGKGPLSILEMVIRQTAPFAELSEGRLSVFWTDQLFLPSSVSWDPPKSEVEVLSIELPYINKTVFSEKKLSQYGLWSDGQFYDKVAEKDFANLSPLDNVSINLGSFSITSSLLEALLKGFQKQLADRKGKLDTDPDWWTAATLPRDLYLKLKGQDRGETYDRIQKIVGQGKVKTRLLGAETDWWDFGTVESYRRQLFKLLTVEKGESESLRRLFGLKKGDFQGDSLVFQSELEDCSFKKSILLHVKGKNAHFDHTLAIDSSFSHGTLSHALIYGAKE